MVVSVFDLFAWIGDEDHHSVWLKSSLLEAAYLGGYWNFSVKSVRQIQIDTDSSYLVQLVGKFVV